MLKQLTEAIQIFSKYDNRSFVPLIDLVVCIRCQKVSKRDKNKLEELGFIEVPGFSEGTIAFQRIKT
jgi:hypothetical protein